MKKIIPLFIFICLITPCNKKETPDTIIKKHTARLGIMLNKSSKVIYSIKFKQYPIWEVKDSPYLFYVFDTVYEDSYLISFQESQIFVHSVKKGYYFFDLSLKRAGWYCKEAEKLEKFKNCFDNACFKKCAVHISYIIQNCIM